MSAPILKSLIRTNRILEKRKDDSDVGYYSFVGLSLCLILLFSAVILYESLTGGTDLVMASWLLVQLAILCDIVLVFMKYRRKAVIEPLNLKVYPLTRWQKFYFFFHLLLFDLKTLVYVLLAAAFLVYFAFKMTLLSAVISLLLWLLLAVTISVWMLTVYRLLSLLGMELREKLMYLFVLIYLLPSILSGFTDYLGVELSEDILFKIPISGQGASVLYGLLTGDGSQIALNFGLLMFILLSGLLVYRLAPSHY